MDRYNKITQDTRKLQRPRIEKNVFSIGGRGHYENPISDILAFFINPREEHGFGMLFLQSLFECADIIPFPRLELVSSPSREQCTDAGNRIDMIAEGESWVLVVENKVRHQAVNPFKEYVEYVEGAYADKQRFYLLLAVEKNENPASGWKSVTWGTYINFIKKNIGTYLTSPNNPKWHIILREFILNIENEYGDTSMSEERNNFVRKNYEAIQEMNEMLNEYIDYMASKGMKTINSALKHGEYVDVASCKRHNWKEGTALRLISMDWGGNTNITLLLKRDGGMIVQLYIYDIAEGELAFLREHIDKQKYKEDWTEQKTIRCFGFFQESEHEMVFAEILDVTRRLNEFYSSRRNGPKE